MIKCVISSKSKRALRVHVTRLILDQITNNERFDLKQIISDVNVLISKSSSTEQGLNYARLVPSLIMQVAALPEGGTVLSHVVKDFGAIAELTNRLNKEDGLVYMETYLDLNRDVLQEQLKPIEPVRTVRELDPVGEHPPIEDVETESDETETESDETEQDPSTGLKQIGHAVDWDYKKRTGRSLKNGDIIEVVYSNSTKPKYDYFLNFKVIGPKGVTVGGGPVYKGAVNDIIIKHIKAGNRVFVKITDALNIMGGYTFAIDRIESKDVISQTPEDVAEANKEIKKVNEEVKSQKIKDKKVIKKAIPKPTILQKHPLQDKTEKEVQNELDIWHTPAMTFFSDVDDEVDSVTLEPYPQKVFAYNVKRRLLKLLTEQTVEEDFGGLNVDGRKIRFKLKVVDNTVVLSIVNEFNEELRFNEETYEIDSNGKPVYYNLVDPTSILEPNGRSLKLSEANARLDSLEKNKGFTRKQAIPALAKEAVALNDIIQFIKSNPDETILLDITGGSLGYIKISLGEGTPLNNITEGDIIIGSELEQAKDASVKIGIPYITTKGLHNKLIPIQQPGVIDNPLFNVIKDLLYNKDLINSQGDPISPAERLTELQKLISVNDKNSLIKFTIGKTASQYKVTLIGFKTIEDLAKKVNDAGFPIFKLDINKTYINNSIDVPTIVDNKISYKKQDYREFLNTQNFYASTKDVSKDGKLRRNNAYFVFSLNEESSNLIYNEKVKKREVEQDTQIKENIKEIESLPKTDLDDQPMSIDDTLKSLREDSEFFKNVDQKNRNVETTKEQLKAAEQWYAKHPLAPFLPLKVLFHIVNGKNKNNIATLTKDGITLYKGSDSTEIYHEAWHGFAQFFMTKEQKKVIYDEVRKQKGSFYDHNGYRVQFELAEDIQIEEYLAEEFRSYMLNNQKPNKNSPKRNNLFKRIWNALKILFQNLDRVDGYVDVTTNNIIHEIFEKLRVGNISEYSYSYDNAIFNTLNKGVQVWNDQSSANERDYESSMFLVDSVNLFIGEHVDLLNSELSVEEMDHFRAYSTRMEEVEAGRLSISEAERADLKTAIETLQKHINVTNRFTGSLTKNPKQLLAAYVYAHERFKSKLVEFTENAKTEKNSTTLAYLKKQIDLLNFAVDEFGDTTDLKNNMANLTDAKGVIGYHMQATELFKYNEIKLDNDFANEDTDYIAALDGFGHSGNESSLIELAKESVIFALSTLPGYEENKKGVFVPSYNKMGIRNLTKFQPVFNRLARKLSGSTNLTIMYDRMNELSKSYPPVRDLLNRLGNPENETFSEQLLWRAMFNTFSNPRVKLIQTMIETTRDINGKITNKVTVGEAHKADDNIIKQWINDFKSDPVENDYFLRDDLGTYLNVPKILDTFTLTNVVTDPIRFFKAIGITLTPTEELKKELRAKLINYSPTSFLTNIKTLHDSKILIYSLTDITHLPSARITNYFNNLAALEAQYSDMFSNFQVTNVEGNAQYEHSLNNSLTMLANSINTVVDYQELLNTPHIAHLDVREFLTENEAKKMGITTYKINDKGFILNPWFNPDAEASIWLQSMFRLDVDRDHEKWGERRKHLGKNVDLVISNISGLIIKDVNGDSNGIAAASADPYSKILLDVNLALAGQSELMRHADKSTSYSASLTGPLLGNRIKSDTYIPLQDFANNKAEINLVNKLLPYLIAEMKRMQRLRVMSKDPTLRNQDFTHIDRGSKWLAFDKIVITSKTELEKFINSTDSVENSITDPKILTLIKTDILNYFKKQVIKNTGLLHQADFTADNIKQKFNDKKVDDSIKNISRFYTYNNWLYNIESIGVLYGGLVSYDHSKQDLHKRNAGAGSTGILYGTDSFITNFINNKLYNNSYGKVNSKKLNIPEDKNTYLFNGQLKTAILQDQAVKFVNYDHYVKLFGEDAADIKAYGKDQNEADAQGLIAFDVYRQLRVADGSWSHEHEMLFTAIIKGNVVAPEKVVKFFPVIKGQYWGPLKTTGAPLSAFHKYALFPMIPSIIQNRNMEHLHNRMVKEGVGYVTFKSGSKMATITKDRNGEDKLYKNNKRLVDEIKDLTNEELYFTPNIIHLQYLKNQLHIHDAFKNKVVFSTQLRKLIELGLVANGIPTDFEVNNVNRKTNWEKIKTDEKLARKTSKNYDLYKTYENNLSKLAKLEKRKLLKELNWSLDETGKPIGNIDNLLAFVEKELIRQDLADHAIDYLKYKKDLSLHLDVEKIEKLLSALIYKRLIKYEFNGEGLVQVASTLFENSDIQEGDFTNATKEQLEKYNSDSLAFYTRDVNSDLPTNAMQVKIAMQNDFLHLLQHPDVLELAKDEKIIGQANQLKQQPELVALNVLIKDQTWLNKDRNREMITMVGVRIPVQGLNSMEFMEVHEFLEPGAGNILIPPTEIVTKSGSDFDVDKMTVIMPNIALINNTPTLYNTGITTKSEEDIINALNNIRNDINDIYDDYADIFKQRYEKDPNALLKEELVEIEKLKEKIKKEKEIKAEYIKRRRNLNQKQQIPRIINLGISLDKEIENTTLRIDDLYGRFKQYRIKYDTILKQERQKELDVLEKQRGTLKQELNSLSGKAIQNDILLNIKNILALPSNFKSLVTPNSTDYWEIGSDGTEKTSISHKAGKLNNDYNHLEQADGKTGTSMSPTTALEITYNFNKHQHNRIGKETLAIGAIGNTYNALLNRVGAYLNPNTFSEQGLTRKDYVQALEQYEVFKKQPLKEQKAKPLSPKIKDIIENYSEQTILMHHNKLNGGVSLSDMKDSNPDPKKQKSIPDLINQLMNGWVDVAKKSWVFNVQANKEGTPVLEYLLEAGVVMEEAVYFMSNPLIKAYLEQQRKAKSISAQLLQVGKISNTNFKHIAQTAILKQYFELESLSKVNFRKLLNDNTYAILDSNELFDLKTLIARAESNDLSKINTIDKSIFLHYLQLEEISTALRDLKMATNVDTSKDSSLFMASNRNSMLEKLRNSGILPKTVITNIEKDSPVSGFFIQDFQTDLFGILLPERNHKTLNDYAHKNITQTIIKATFGTKEDTVTAWKSDLMNFIFQNELRFFDINHKSYYRNREIKHELEKINLKYGAFVKDNTLYIDTNSLHQQYINAHYLSKTYHGYNALSTIDPRTFANEQEYIHYVLERESLRAVNPLTETLTDSLSFKIKKIKAQRLLKQSDSESNTDYEKKLIGYTYELYLSDEALDNIYNHWKIFNSFDNYADQFLNIRKNFPALNDNFALIKELSKNSKNGIHNLKLNNAKLDKFQKNLFFENLQNLSNPVKVREVLPDANDQDITDIIKLFSRMHVIAFLQSGMNTKSIYNLTSFVSQDMMLTLMEAPNKNFKKLLNNPDNSNTITVLDNYTALFKELNSDRVKRVRGKNFNLNISFTNRESIKNMGVVTPDYIIQPVTENQTTVEPSIKVLGFDFISGNEIDVDGEISEQTKMTIETGIAKYVEKLHTEKIPITFNELGYGQDLLLNKTPAGKLKSINTFLYLSKRLYQAFGYVNPKYLQTTTGRIITQKDQTITDADIKEVMDGTVEAYINIKCK